MVNHQLPTGERNAAEQEGHGRGEKYALPARRPAENPIDEARLGIRSIGQTLTRRVSKSVGRTMQQLPEQRNQ